MDATKVEARMRQSPRDFRLQQDRHQRGRRESSFSPPCFTALCCQHESYLDDQSGSVRSWPLCDETCWEQHAGPSPYRTMEIKHGTISWPSLIALSTSLPPSSAPSLLLPFTSFSHSPFNMASSSAPVYIVSAVRTPVGQFLG
jgi:hypothetical protein